MAPSAGRTLFIYWGRRGALSHFVLALASSADSDSIFCISRQNELFDAIRRTGAHLLPIETFEWGFGALLCAWRLFGIRRRLAETIRQASVQRVVVLMPHVWTPLIASAVRRAGARYVVVVHDARAHPGDQTGRTLRWLLRDAAHADEVITLSRHVADQLTADMPRVQDRIRTLFHPTLASEAAPYSGAQADPTPGFVFFGRVMAYKGLPLFVEACERLRARGIQFRVGVVGEGSLGELAPRLARINAEIVNRWIDYKEFPAILSRYDAFVVPSVEASQSGVVSVAHGFGLPVIATPAGGLVEQVEDGRTGLLADGISAGALADVMERWLTDAGLRARLQSGVMAAQQRHSMRRFYELLTQS